MLCLCCKADVLCVVAYPLCSTVLSFVASSRNEKMTVKIDKIFLAWYRNQQKRELFQMWVHGHADDMRAAHFDNPTALAKIARMEQVVHDAFQSCRKRVETFHSEHPHLDRKIWPLRRQATRRRTRFESLGHSIARRASRFGLCHHVAQVRQRTDRTWEAPGQKLLHAQPLRLASVRLSPDFGKCRSVND